MSHRTHSTLARNRDELSARARHQSSAVDPIELILSKLDGLRRCGKGHIARCPAHEDRTASLSINVGEDGRVLLHCFAGCAAADVLAAVGLELADLFVRRPEAMTVAERAAFRDRTRTTQWQAALNVIDLEALVVQIAARQMIESGPLAPADFDRLVIASNRISDARSVLSAR